MRDSSLERGAPTRPLVLVIDDSPEDCIAYRRYLGADYRVLEADDGETGVALAMRERPDAILLDYRLQAAGDLSDGLQVLEALNAACGPHAFAVVMLTGTGEREVAVQALKRGAHDYLDKSATDAAQLRHAVRGALHARDLSRELEAERAKFAAAFRASPVPMVIAGFPDGRFEDANLAFTRVFGYTQAELAGRTSEDIGLYVDPGRREVLYRSVVEPRSEQGVEAQLRTRSREVRTVRIYVQLVQVNQRRFLVGLIIDMTEHARLGTDREWLIRALQEDDRRKDQFLAMLAHELRNPLAPIRSAVELLRRNLDPLRLERTHAMIERQVGHLTRLVDDLLDVSRVTQGKVTLRTVPLDIVEAVYAGVDIARPFIDARHHELTLTLPPPGQLWVDGDPTRLAQVVGNILNNAAKYTDERGAIALAVTGDGDWVTVAARDNGIGIPADLLPQVFDVFTQAERSLDRAQGGLGIGLSLVKSLVELHGGTVVAASDGPGRGSTFSIRLPQRAPAAVVASADVPRPVVRSRCILVVDDNRDAADSIAALLELDGHRVCCAYDGREAVGRAEAFGPEVALVDLGMPGMDGFAVARALHALPVAPRISCIALTGYGQDRDRDRSREAGFVLHLVKPVAPEALAAAIAALAPNGV